MSLVKDLKRAYGCPYDTAEWMRRHINGCTTSPSVEAILGLGPIRVHWRGGWHLNNRPVSLWRLREAWVEAGSPSVKETFS